MEADVRPGLVKSHKIARRLKMEEKKEQMEVEQKHKQKPVKQLEEERREEGLKSAISTDNKGFAMLAKMGYKQGDAIGRSSTGIVEPISIQIKCDRAGLGRAAAIKQLEEYKQRLRQAKAEQKTETSSTSISQFRQRMAQKNNDKQLEADLWYGFCFSFIKKRLKMAKNLNIRFGSFFSKCQRACEKLDLDASVETAAMPFFWPIRKTVEPSETTDDPYSDKSEGAPKRKRKESSTSDDSDEDGVTHKRFGEFPGSDDSSSSSSSEEERPRFEEIPTDEPNEDDEFEVLFQMKNVENPKKKLLIVDPIFLLDIRKTRNVDYLFTHNILILPLVWCTFSRCRRYGS